MTTKNRKTVVKNFRLTQEQWERFQRIPANTGETWQFSDVIENALQDNYHTCEMAGTLRPAGVLQQTRNLFYFVPIEKPFVAPELPDLDQFEEPGPELPAIAAKPARSKRKTTPIAAKDKRKTMPAKKPKPSTRSTPASNGRAKKGGKK